MPRRPAQAAKAENGSDAQPMVAFTAAPWWQPRGMNLLEAARHVGLGKTKWWELVESGDAPQPVELTPGRKVWLREEVDHWLDERAARRQDRQAPNPWDRPAR